MARATRGRDLTVLNELSNRRDLGTCRNPLCLGAGRTTHGKPTMQKKFGIAVVTAILATRLAAQSQGIPGGIKHEAAEGSAVGGPVGKGVGGVPGGARGLLGANERLAFRE